MKPSVITQGWGTPHARTLALLLALAPAVPILAGLILRAIVPASWFRTCVNLAAALTLTPLVGVFEERRRALLAEGRQPLSRLWIALAVLLGILLPQLFFIWSGD